MHTVKDLLPLAPKYHAWVDDLLRRHAACARPVASAQFPRLPQFFSKEAYNSARFVVVDTLPQTPWADLGLPVPEGMDGPFAGVTYRNTYFVTPAVAGDESLHCHEMVHVVQWRILGNDLFPLLYGQDVLAHGYQKCFLEVMARQFQAIFNKRDQVVVAEAFVTMMLGVHLPPILIKVIKGEL